MGRQRVPPAAPPTLASAPQGGSWTHFLDGKVEELKPTAQGHGEHKAEVRCGAELGRLHTGPRAPEERTLSPNGDAGCQARAEMGVGPPGGARLQADSSSWVPLTVS